MRILVAGSKDYWLQEKLWVLLYEIDQEFGIDEVMHTDEKGASKLAADWANHNKVPTLPYFGDWKHLGSISQTFMYNRMLWEGRPRIVVVFPTTTLAECPNSQDIVRQAKHYNIDTCVVEGDTVWMVTPDAVLELSKT